MRNFKVVAACASAIALCVVFAGCSASVGSGSAASSSAASPSAASSPAASASTSASASAEASSAASSASSASAEAPAGSESAASSEAAPSASAASAEAPSSAAAPAAAESLVAADELANVDTVIEYGQFDEMVALSKAIQNGEMTGKVVKVDGVVLHFGQGMSYGVSQYNADKTERRGTTFVIMGLDEEQYPMDEAHIIITGKVCADPEVAWSYKIYTLPEFVEVVED